MSAASKQSASGLLDASSLLADRVRDAAIRVTPGATGRAVAEVRTPDGQWIAIHDPDQPEAEISALLDRDLKGRAVPPVAVLIGVGLGYVVQELLRRRHDIRILAIELVPGLFEACRPYHTWNVPESNGRILVASDLRQPMPTPSWPPSTLDEKPLVVVNPMLGRHFPEAFLQARAAAKQFLYEQRANAEARQRLAGLYFNHTIENLPAVLAGTDVSALDGIADGQALVLIGAGPSLDRLMPALQKHRDRAWYVALDTSLRPLMSAGITPDLVVSVDPTPLNGRHLLDLPVRSRPWLVAEASLDPRAINAFAGRTFFCKIGRADPWPWLEPLDLIPTKLKVWGSVLTASCDLFTRMKASRVIFAGLDLSYTNGQPYCRGTAFEQDWRLQQERDGLASIEAVWQKRISEIAVEDVDRHGRCVQTAPQMVAFRNWVRTVVTASQGVRFINVSERGILHGDGIEHAKCGDALAGVSGHVDAGVRLAAVGRRSFAAAAPRVIETVDALIADPQREQSGLWNGWQEMIPGFDGQQTHGRLLQTSRRLHSENPGAAPHSEWIDVPFDAGFFYAKAPLEWIVQEKNVITYAYRVRGKTMELAFKVQFSTLAGRPTRQVCLRIPGNYLPARSMVNTIWLAGMTGKQPGYATVHPGLDSLVLQRANETRFAAEPGSFFAFGQITFEIQ